MVVSLKMVFTGDGFFLTMGCGLVRILQHRVLQEAVAEGAPPLWAELLPAEYVRRGDWTGGDGRLLAWFCELLAKKSMISPNLSRFQQFARSLP